MAITLHSYLADVTGVTIRDCSGSGSQLELLINSRRDGLMSLRLIGSRDRVIRVTDMRKRDKGRQRKVHGLIEVPMTEIIKQAKEAARK